MCDVVRLTEVWRLTEDEEDAQREEDHAKDQSTDPQAMIVYTETQTST
jgi:hypothetical protein